MPNRNGSFDEQPAREGRHRVGVRLPVRSRNRDLRAILQRQVGAYWAQDRPGVADQVRRCLAARINVLSGRPVSVLGVQRERRAALATASGGMALRLGLSAR
nr:hypothetical protein [uncultured Rhodopila sp.]